jgi:hypothetical protein
MSHSKQFVDQVASGQSSDAKETIENALSAMAFEALETRKQEIASTMFGGVNENNDPNYHKASSHFDKAYNEYYKKNKQNHDSEEELDYAAVSHAKNSLAKAHPGWTASKSGEVVYKENIDVNTIKAAQKTASEKPLFNKDPESDRNIGKKYGSRQDAKSDDEDDEPKRKRK